MPRRHDRARERARAEPPRAPRSVAPAWAVVPGFAVHQVHEASKTYRCPGCDHEIGPSVIHLVVVPDDEPDLRRHWHTPCWRQEIARGRF